MAGLRRRAVAARTRVLEHGGDAGFTLVEVLMAMVLVGIVMGALTTFFVTTMAVTNIQGDKQTAVQLAADGTERVRSLKGSAVAAQRDKTSSDTQWASPVAGVAPYLSTLQETWDTSAVYPDGATAPLPTQPLASTVNGVAYNQHWYVGKCWQPLNGGDCAPTYVSGYVEFFRVLVAVTWPDRHCASSLCSYVTSTLVSSRSSEPVFNENATATPPTVANPGNQVGEVTGPVSLQVNASGGAAPITFTATGLPTGLSMSSSGLVTGTPTAAGSYSVTATATDAIGLTGTAAFTWTVNAALQVTNPGAQTSSGGVAASLTMARTGGTTPVTWAVTAPGGWGATGLPAGLSLNTSTGVINGTPTVTGSANVTVTGTDASGKASSVTFLWSVPALSLTTPAMQNGTVGTPITPLQVVASGGVQAYTWSATNLPNGLTLDTSTGRVTGTPTKNQMFNVTVTVTDAAGTTLTTAVFQWKIV
jgi:prepilin-type N-terminal cleavage/methylation domain-containing protein